jgi:hypothetical protein
VNALDQGGCTRFGALELATTVLGATTQRYTIVACLLQARQMQQAASTSDAASGKHVRSSKRQARQMQQAAAA